MFKKNKLFFIVLALFTSQNIIIASSMLDDPKMLVSGACALVATSSRLIADSHLQKGNTGHAAFFGYISVFYAGVSFACAALAYNDTKRKSKKFYE